MFELRSCTAANTALLNNFEIVATAIIALIFFTGTVCKQLWCAIALMTIASILLFIEQDDIAGAFRFFYGSRLVLAATICWGLENNCTRQIADRDPLEIVIIKGFGSDTGILVLALVQDNSFPSPTNLLITSIVMATGCRFAAKESNYKAPISLTMLGLLYSTCVSLLYIQ